MKSIRIGLIIFLCAGHFCFASDPLEGYWLSIDDHSGQVTGGWEIYREGDQLYGKLLSSAEQPNDALAVKCRESYKNFPIAGKVNQMQVIGTPWIFGLSSETPGQWTGGNIIDPTNGTMYKCKLIFHAAGTGEFADDTLEMRGEIGFGIGRSQFWQKTVKETAESLSCP
ncbi:MAG TPA: DUF2147 domain-containing protein [Treponema sp.]|nr:DUF2147 domain-containing protein [Treponema sp.]